MSGCDKGYVCDVCEEDVEDITESGLYLQYVIGEVDQGALLISDERHIRCYPELAQFIIDQEFEPVVVEGPSAKANMDTDERQKREDLVTRGWRRLQEVRELGVGVDEYPLEEVRAG